MGKTIVVPQTAYGFESEYNSMKWDENLLHQFFREIPPENYLKLFKSSAIPPDIFSHIVKTLIEKEPSIDISIKIIFNLCKTQSIDLTLMMLDDAEKNLILKLVEKFEKESKLEDRENIAETIKWMVD